MSIVYYENGKVDREENVGLVLSLFERGSFMDSYYTDYCAVVWNPDTKTPETVLYYCNRNENSHAVAKADAPSEVVLAYEQYKAEVQRKREEQFAAEEAAREKVTPRKGKMLVVIRGRKIKHGTSGICFWAGETRFGRSVGLKLADGQKVFTAERNVKVVR